MTLFKLDKYHYIDSNLVLSVDVDWDLVTHVRLFDGSRIPTLGTIDEVAKRINKARLGNVE